jgi:hypothetical protein
LLVFVSPISSPSFDSFIGVPVGQISTPAATADGAANGVKADVNWLMTWLDQAEPALEESERKQAETAEPARPKQIQWLTLLQAVPAMQVVPAPVTVDTAALESAVADEGAAENVNPSLIVEKLPTEEPKDGETKPAIVDIVMPSIAVPVSQPVIVPVDTGVDASAPPPLESQNTPILSATVKVPQPTEMLPPTAPKADKGELIWAADFVVADKASEPVENDALPQASSEPVESASPAKTMPVEAAPRREGSETGSRQQSAGEQRQGEKQAAQPASVEPIERAERPEPAEPPRSEHQTPAAMKHEVSVVGPASPVSGRTEPVAPSSAVEAPPAPATGIVELDNARPLRPAQIATIYVDVPSAAGSGDAGTIRLAVTQRGDQVNVRLRSWNTGAAPIENERMQPLLQTLSEQGYEATKKSIEPLDDRGPQAIERLAEKPLAAAESANSNNDQQSFQNADDRQRKNQERQQQAWGTLPLPRRTSCSYS